METITEKLGDKIVKTIDIKSVIYSSITLLAAILMMVAVTATGVDPTAWLYMTAMTLGVTLGGIAIVKLIFRNKSWIYLPTKSPIKAYQLFFQSEHFEQLSTLIRNGDFAALAQTAAHQNSGIRLDVVFSGDGNFSACVLSKYVPYSYEPVDNVYELPSDHIAPFNKMVKAIK